MRKFWYIFYTGIPDGFTVKKYSRTGKNLGAKYLISPVR